MKALFMKTLCINLSLAVVFIAMSLTGIAQEAAKDSKQSPEPKATPVAQADASVTAVANVKPKAFAGRLPRFYASIVNSRQRAEIYDIQRSFVLQKQRIEQQLAEVRQAELDAIEQVLNEQQRSQLHQMRSTAESKSSASKAKQVVDDIPTAPEIAATGDDASTQSVAKKSVAKESQAEAPVESSSKMR